MSPSQGTDGPAEEAEAEEDAAPAAEEAAPAGVGAEEEEAEEEEAEAAEDVRGVRAHPGRAPPALSRRGVRRRLLALPARGGTRGLGGGFSWPDPRLFLGRTAASCSTETAEGSGAAPEGAAPREARATLHAGPPEPRATVARARHRLCSWFAA